MTTREVPPRQRTSRRARVRARPIRLRERDVDILLALAKMRLLRTRDVADLFFKAPGTAQKRLRKLFDAGLVRAIVRDLAAENRYALTTLGHGLLVRALPDEDVPVFRAAPRVDGRSLAHLDLLNRYRIALARGCERQAIRLVRFVPEWELRSAEPHATLIPDAVAVLEAAGGVLILAIEVDVATEPPATVVKKLERYDALALAGTPVCGARSPRVVLVVSSARRARSLARAIAPHRPLRPALGAAPFILQDGGLSTGLAPVEALAQCDGALSAEHFMGALTRGRCG